MPVALRAMRGATTGGRAAAKGPEHVRVAAVNGRLVTGIATTGERAGAKSPGRLRVAVANGTLVTGIVTTGRLGTVLSARRVTGIGVPPATGMSGIGGAAMTIGASVGRGARRGRDRIGVVPPAMDDRGTTRGRGMPQSVGLPRWLREGP